MKARIVILVAVSAVVASAIVAGLLGAFDEETPITGTPAPVHPDASVATSVSVPAPPISTASSVPPVKVVPPSADMIAELESIGYAYDAAVGVWRATDSVGLAELVLEGSGKDARIVEARLDDLVCDAPAPFDLRPSALIMAIGGMGEWVPADTTVDRPKQVGYYQSEILIATFTCYRV